MDGGGSDGAGEVEREVERLSSDLLEGRVPSSDAPMPPPAQAAPLTGQSAAPAGTGSDATARAVFVMRTLDDIAAPVPIGFDPAPPAPPPDVSTTTEGLLDLQGVDLEAVRAGLARPEPGASFQVRHRYHGAIAAVGIVALAAFVGALLFLSGSSGSPAAVAQAPAAAPVASPVDPSPVDPSLVASSDNPMPEPTDSPSPAPTLEPTPAPSPTPGNVTIRGPIDASEFSATTTSMRVGTHEAVLAFDPEGGPVSGTFTIEIKEFPIGLLLTSTFKGEKDPGFAEFKDCTVTLGLVAQAKGTYDADTGKLSGKAAFKSVTDDVDDCLKTRPSNLSIDPDEVTKPTTVTWRATFNGTRATGRLGLKPAMDFSATVED